MLRCAGYHHNEKDDSKIALFMLALASAAVIIYFIIGTPTDNKDHYASHETVRVRESKR